jgi:hypothetical protein
LTPDYRNILLTSLAVSSHSYVTEGLYSTKQHLQHTGCSEMGFVRSGEQRRKETRKLSKHETCLTSSEREEYIRNNLGRVLPITPSLPSFTTVVLKTEGSREGQRSLTEVMEG